MVWTTHLTRAQDYPKANPDWNPFSLIVKTLKSRYTCFQTHGTNLDGKA